MRCITNSAQLSINPGGEGGLRSHEPVFHDWHVSTVLPSAGLGDFSIETGRGYPIRTDGRY